MLIGHVVRCNIALLALYGRFWRFRYSSKTGSASTQIDNGRWFAVQITQLDNHDKATPYALHL